jgi:hypothetical protein
MELRLRRMKTLFLAKRLQENTELMLALVEAEWELSIAALTC